MSEVMKIPLILTAICSIGGGPGQIGPVFREAISKPFGNVWIALCYTFNNRASSRPRLPSHRAGEADAARCCLSAPPALRARQSSTLTRCRRSALSPTRRAASSPCITAPVGIRAPCQPATTQRKAPARAIRLLQVLSQSKTLFTAGLMYVLVRKRLAPRQVVAIVLLVAGAVLVQLQELIKAAAPAAAVGAGSIYWAAGLVLFSSFISALPNVYYEKVLKTEGENQWVNNVQVTAWITLWVSLNGLLQKLRGMSAGSVGSFSAGALLEAARSMPDALSEAFAGFTLPVWGVVMLKALNGILIPATFKYADNLLYSYAKPSSIVVTTVLGALMAGAMPPTSLLLGVGVVVTSILLYNSKPKKSD